MKKFMKKIREVFYSIGIYKKYTYMIVDDLDNPKNNQRAVKQIKDLIKKIKPIVVDLKKLKKNPYLNQKFKN